MLNEKFRKLLLLFGVLAIVCAELLPFATNMYEQKLDSMRMPKSIDNEQLVVPPPGTSETHYPYTAYFSVVTNDFYRSFDYPMYKSPTFTAGEPNIIHVTQPTTWQDFFEPIPFSFDFNCLYAGTGEAFCTNDTYEMHYYLNDALQNDMSFLNKQIMPEDNLRIVYE